VPNFVWSGSSTIPAETHTQFFELFRNQEPVTAIAEHPDIAERRAVQAPEGLLGQRVGGGEPVELLREGLTRQGPEARAGTAHNMNGNIWTHVPAVFAVPPEPL
jgi:hypothetical protein